MNNLFAHPCMSSSPELIRALQERLGLRAVVDGHRVRLVGTPQWRGRPAPACGTESRNGQAFAQPDRTPLNILCAWPGLGQPNPTGGNDCA